MNAPSVLISVLNWNNAEKTIECINSLRNELSLCTAKVELCVIDNGSKKDEYSELYQNTKNSFINLIRLEENRGYTGGHNISIRRAIEVGFKYIWLLNNDATVDKGCLNTLLSEIEDDDLCGAVSPVINPESGNKSIAAWGGLHEWTTRETRWFDTEFQSIEAHTRQPNEIFVAGTAIFLRTAALKEVGELDDRLFAYYDDSDMGVRLAKAGWRSKVVFNASIKHGWRDIDNLPPYFFYLMYRNEMIFWWTHLPIKFKGFVWIKLIDQALYNAARLERRGLEVQANAALIGVWDFILKKHGKPCLERQVPTAIKFAFKISGLMYRRRLKNLPISLQSSS